jgi:hypothetical protein
MNLAMVIGSIRSAWAEDVGIELHLENAPNDAQIPYAVMVLGQISAGVNEDTGTKEYEATPAFTVFVADDTEAINAMDAMDTTLARGRLDYVYSSQFVSGQISFAYSDQASFWVAESSYSIRWTKEL